MSSCFSQLMAKQGNPDPASQTLREQEDRVRTTPGHLILPVPKQAGGTAGGAWGPSSAGGGGEMVETPRGSPKEAPPTSACRPDPPQLLTHGFSFRSLHLPMSIGPSLTKSQLMEGNLLLLPAGTDVPTGQEGQG